MSSEPSGTTKKKKKDGDGSSNDQQKQQQSRSLVGGGGSSSTSKQQQQPSSSSANNNNVAQGVLFPIGPSAKRELKRTLVSAKNPVTTITKFQQAHSLHTMMSKAFNTTPKHQVSSLNVTTRSDRASFTSTSNNNNNNGNTAAAASSSSIGVETLDTDSVMTFLHHLGVRQYEVHKRISDAILKNLELEIKKISPSNDSSSTASIEPLLDLLKQCWAYATTLPELRPILWAVLKQLGSQTPTPVLIALAERASSSSKDDTTKNKKQQPSTLVMKHADVFRPLPASLKRLVWEADWDNIIAGVANGSGTVQDQQLQQQLTGEGGNVSNLLSTYKERVQSTLLFHTIAPYVHQYVEATTYLVENANRVYVSTIAERRVLTSQRRALTKISNTTTSTSTATGSDSVAPVAASTTTTTTTNTASLLRQAGAVSGATAVGAGATTATTGSSSAIDPVSASHKTSGKAISHIRSLLCDTVGTASSYRPKLLFNLLTILIAHHGGANLQFGMMNASKTQQHDKKKLKTTDNNDDKDIEMDPTGENNDDAENSKKNKNDENNDDEIDDNAESSTGSSSFNPLLVVCGARNLHCTLVADILLSAGGPLPKAYTHVVALAQILDECVQEGNVTDTNLIKIQSTLKLIFQPASSKNEDDGTGNNVTTGATGKNPGTGKDSSNNTNKGGKDTNTSTKEETVIVLSKEEQRLLNKHIRNGIEDMKKADTQNLFLNPVTDDIAPGYSKIISHPMCITTMESKIITNEYKSIQDWEDDVRLMYKNCIDYNQGATGQWFRGEANRQSKIFKERIVPKLRRLHQSEKAKQLPKSNPKQTPATLSSPSKDASALNENGKRGLASPTEATKEVITPLQPTVKRRKKEKEDFIPSMPALASMLLADPFVVRIFVARILRDLRAGVIGGHGLPYSHNSIPSMLQVLYLSQWSRHVCSIWGKKFVVPPPGFEDSSNAESGPTDPTEHIPFQSLRKCLPLLLRLLVEAELDKRTAVKGDLYSASQASPIKLPPIVPDVWKQNDGVHLQMSLTLVKGSLVHLCQVGNRNEQSLHLTFPKFASTLLASSNVSAESLSTLLEDRVFFDCLITALLRHKSKLPKDARDAIIESWLQWLRAGPAQQGHSVVDDDEEASTIKKGSMTSVAHERLLHLLNEWHTHGGGMIPRDKLLGYATQVVHATNESEIDKNRRFDRLWNAHLRKKKKKRWIKYAVCRREFIAVKKQYERMLGLVPESSTGPWKEQVGIAVPESAAGLQE